MSTPQTPSPFAPCDKLADEIDLVQRWWGRLPQGATLVQENLDVLALLLRYLRAEAYHAATGVRMFAAAMALIKTVTADPADTCPKCGGDLDTGWECNTCGHDARPPHVTR